MTPAVCVYLRALVARTAVVTEQLGKLGWLCIASILLYC